MVLAATAALSAGAARAATGDGYMTEAGFDIWGSDDSQRVTASYRWHLNPSKPLVWQAGARLGAEGIGSDPFRSNAVTGGLFGGASWATGRLWPTVVVGADSLFVKGDQYESETTISAGARYLLQNRGTVSYAVHVMAYRSDISGSGPDQSGYGISIGLHQTRLSPAAVSARCEICRGQSRAGLDIVIGKAIAVTTPDELADALTYLDCGFTAIEDNTGSDGP